jgi:hypothetical protein
MAREREEPVHGHVEPLAVAPDLEPLVGEQHLARLAHVGLRVRVDLLAREHGPRGRAPGGIPHARGVVPDDQDDRVAGVLELAELGQDDRMAEVDVGRRRVQAELDAERPALRQLRGQGSRGQAVDGVAGEMRGPGGGLGPLARRLQSGFFHPAQC